MSISEMIIHQESICPSCLVRFVDYGSESIYCHNCNPKFKSKESVKVMKVSTKAKVLSMLRLFGIVIIIPIIVILGVIYIPVGLYESAIYLGIIENTPMLVINWVACFVILLLSFMLLGGIYIFLDEVLAPWIKTEYIQKAEKMETVLTKNKIAKDNKELKKQIAIRQAGMLSKSEMELKGGELSTMVHKGIDIKK